MKTSTLAFLLTSDKKKVLLVKRRDVPVWVLPGGGREGTETLEASCVREVFEESKVVAKAVRLRAIYHPQNRLTTITHVYELEALKGSPQPTPEAIEAKYFPLNALPKDLFFIHKNMIDDIKNSSFVERELNEVNYKALIMYGLTKPIYLIRYLLSRAGFALNKKGPR